MNYLVYNKDVITDDSTITNIIVEDSKIVVRFLIRRDQVDFLQDSVKVTSIDHDQLLSITPIFSSGFSIPDSSEYYCYTHESNEYILSYESAFELDKAKALGAWHPHAVFSLDAPCIKRYNKNNSYYLVEDLIGYSLYKNSILQKSVEYAYRSNLRGNSLFSNIITCSVLTDSDNFSTVSKIVKVNNKTLLISNLQFDKEFDNSENIVDTELTFPELFLSYEITGADTISVGGLETYTVQSYLNGEPYKDNSIMEIEAVSGYCPSKRLIMKDGVGTFKIRALDLESGELLRVKINDYGFTSRLEKQIIVV